MLYITGDIHGDVNRINLLKRYCLQNHTSDDDIMILLGDVGINFYGNDRDKICKEKMSKVPVTFVCIRGNHEMRPENAGTCIESVKFGNKVLVEKEYPNIIWLRDGYEYKIEDRNVLAIGGAYSVDWQHRLLNGWPWFEDEQLNESERNAILERIAGKHFEIVLTHTCPDSWQPRELFIRGLNQLTVDKSMELWLEKVKDSIEFDKWYFGHFHGEKDVPEEKYEMLYELIRKI